MKQRAPGEVIEGRLRRLLLWRTGDGVRGTFPGEILRICSIELIERAFYNGFMNEISMVPSLFKFMYGGFYKSTFSFTFL